MALAEPGGLVAEHVRPDSGCGINARLKIPYLVAGADSIDDVGLLRRGAMSTLSGGDPGAVHTELAPGPMRGKNARQLEKAGRMFLIAKGGQAPLLPGTDTPAFTGIDSMQKWIYGHHEQGAKFGHTKIQDKSLLVRDLNALAAVVSTPLSAPVIAATRPRGGGNAASARGAASLAA